MSLVTATQYCNVRQRAAARPNVQTGRASAPGRANLFLPTATAGRVMLRDWYWRELKEGGFLFNYLHQERARTPQAIRRVARLMTGFQQNPKSDFRRLATIPAKLYHRWKEEDEHFWDDDSNLRSLKRDNPDLPIYVAPRPMPASRFRKVFPQARSAA